MSATAPPTDTPPPLEQQESLSLEQLRGGLRGFSERWLPRADELHGFFERWDQAWNTHDLDLLGTLVTEDILCDDPAMFGQTVESREEFLAFLEDLFRAFPDVRFQATGDLYLALEGGGITLPWRMTGSFTGELRTWSKNREAQPHTTEPTGKTFDLEGVDLYQFRDGLLANYSIVYDLLGFSAQIGLIGMTPSGGALNLGADTKAVLVADAVMFLCALLLGVWKYRQIVTSENHQAHIYVDIATGWR